MIKILLTSDLHIGSTDLPIRHSDRINTLKRIIALAKEYDIIMIAGDLFDSPDPAPEHIAEISQYFSLLRKKGTAIVYVPGDRECAGGSVPAFSATLPVDRFFSDDSSVSPFTIEKDGQTLHIYGLPACARTGITTLEKECDTGFHIGLFHTDFDLENNEENKPDAGLRKKDIRNLKLDFYAMGHNHTFKLYKYNDRIIGAYPGSPEPVHSGETGDRYIVALTIDNDELIQIKRLTINTVTMSETEFSCTPDCESGLRSFIESCISEKVLLSLQLKGARGNRSYAEICNEYRSRFYGIILDDRTVAPLNALIQEFAKEDSLRGEFFSLLNEKIETGHMPDDIDTADFSKILSGIVRSKNTVSEEMLCELFNA